MGATSRRSSPSGAGNGSPAEHSGGLVSWVVKLFLGLLSDWSWFWVLAGLVLAAEALLGAIIIIRVPYTEIDWVAYMEEVGGYQSGERDYTKLGGGTGPLVYPAGFVYIFWALKAVTNQGENVRAAQWMFLGFYLVLTALVLAIYQRAGRRVFPPWVVLLLMLSKRVHSIFMLRLFNDGVSILLMHVAVLLLTYRKWTWASVWFTVALSVKMNILLFLPALGIMMLRNIGIVRTALQMGIVVTMQALIGVEFLVAYPWQYLSKAFELSRVFFYKWTVNFRFLPEELFVSKQLAHALLACTAIGVAAFVLKWCAGGGGFRSVFGVTRGRAIDSSRAIVLALFSSQLVGVVFSRTIHYQFYSWYFHTLPFLLWHTRLPTVVRIAMLAGIEYAYNVFPSTSASSAILQACHLVLLLAVYLAPTVYGHEDIVCTRINGDAALRKKLGSRAGAAGGVTVVAVDSKGLTVESSPVATGMLAGLVRRYHVPLRIPSAPQGDVVKSVVGQLSTE